MYDPPTHSVSVPTLDDATLARVADLRARGTSWDDAAEAIHWDVIELMRACRADDRYPAATERAQQELNDAAQAEALYRLRELIRDRRARIALAAAEVITRYTTQTRADATKREIEHLRCETRLEVERLRAEAKAGAKAAKDEAKAAEENLEWTEEEKEHMTKVFWRGQEYALEGAAGPGSEAYVWGGRHKLWCTPPGEGDVRVFVKADDTVQGRRLYWVMGYPVPTDSERGPFPGTGPVPVVQPYTPEAFAPPAGAGAPLG